VFAEPRAAVETFAEPRIPMETSWVFEESVKEVPVGVGVSDGPKESVGVSTGSIVAGMVSSVAVDPSESSSEVIEVVEMSAEISTEPVVPAGVSVEICTESKGPLTLTWNWQPTLTDQLSRCWSMRYAIESLG
jgi:hypothetical protein